MSGTYEGGLKARNTNLKNNPNFYSEIGRKGGSRGKKDGTIKGFARNPELARLAGAMGGKNVKRGKAKKKHIVTVQLGEPAYWSGGVSMPAQPKGKTLIDKLLRRRK